MPQTISEAMVSGVLADITAPPGDALPWYADMAESIPTITASAGTKALRGSSTILRGGTGVGQGFGQGRWVREGLAQANYLSPRNWRGFGTQDYFLHQGPLSTPNAAIKAGAVRQTTYNPFYVAAGINWVGRKMGNESSLIGRTFVGEAARSTGFVGAGQELVSKGFYSRVSAAGRLGWMDDKRYAGRAAAGIEGVIGRPGLAPGVAGPTLGSPYTRIEAQQKLLMMAGTGTLSSRIGGFTSVAMTGKPEARVARELLNAARSSNLAEAAAAKQALRGQRTAVNWGQSIGLDMGRGAQHTTGQILRAGHAAGKGLKVGGKLAKYGKSAGLASARVGGLFVPYVNVGMAMWLAYDLLKLPAKGLGYAAKIGAAVQTSFMGGMNTGIMDQGFTDTEATMTSRARGVQAIQNSRLNARGVLGVEAGAMHAHFG